MRDDHGQPAPGFRKAANRERAVNTLIGIARGMVADQIFNELELNYLHAWMNEFEPDLVTDPDGLDILDQVRTVIADARISREELEDLHDLLDCVVKHRRGGRFGREDEAMHYLGGIIRGIIADQHLHDLEIARLNEWLVDHLFLTEEWPASEIYRRVKLAIKDNVITAEERDSLMEALQLMHGGSVEATGAVGGMATRLFNIDMPDHPVVFEGKTFLLTGKFVFGTRKACTAAIVERGGRVADGVSRAVDFLVVGSLSSRDWINESFGTKIRDAMAMREQGHHILLVEEERWKTFLIE